MEGIEKNVTYGASSSYTTLNANQGNGQKLWFVFHGIGQLSRYFIRNFSELDPETHYIVAPQAPSKYYVNTSYTRIGGCWLTRDRLEDEIGNLMHYLHAVYQKEKAAAQPLIVLGFSQGVSVACRWIALKALPCRHLILIAGGLPEELKPEQFRRWPEKVSLLYGNQDALITDEKLGQQVEKAQKLFGNRAHIQKFDGGHEVPRHLLSTLL